MTNKYDIYERIFKFVVCVIRLIKKLATNESNKVIIAQLLRSATSMGANAQEADGVSTKKDFLHCFTLVRKEGKETVFWLRLMAETNFRIRLEACKAMNEAEEIVAIISKIIQNTRSK